MRIEDVFGWSFVALCVGLVVLGLLDNYLLPWKCSKCGKKHLGKIGKSGFHFGPVGECCAFRQISHAEYNRSFGIRNNLKRIK